MNPFKGNKNIYIKIVKWIWLPIGIPLALIGIALLILGDLIVRMSCWPEPINQWLWTQSVRRGSEYFKTLKD